MLVKEFVNNLIKNENVLVFSKTFCPYCSATKKLLRNLNCPFKLVELDTFRKGKEIQNYLYDITKQKTVPSTFINGKHIGGNDKLQAMYKKGELLPLIKPYINKPESKL
ncbi:glutaredoxin-1 [Anaeromyces robustus]|uniref:Glutaredoxin-1 n=1 Tax=Anaeromyces robustus TaxID=1754192 RepID=A0A1Y1XJJ8_9FUNG|nr:glutaredoxin-1 [Anaeromyces robustus]|eukprot:ORX85920.1 glutaredoxin-1 [Anaeromyces robustus]